MAGAETLIFTCAGAAHSGQVANRAGVGLMHGGVGNLFCTAAVGAGIRDKLERAKSAGLRLVIDGCEDHCARKVMERAGLQVDRHFDVTAIGVEKKPQQPRMIDDTKRVVDHIQSATYGV